MSPARSESVFGLAAVADIVRDIPAGHWAALPVPQRRALEVALHLAEPGDDPIEPSERLGVGEPTPLLFLPDAAEALIGLGVLDRAERLIEGFDRHGRELDRARDAATAKVGHEQHRLLYFE